MTTPTASLHTPSSLLVDDDTAARIALTAAGVAGDVAVHIGIRAFGSAARFVAAVHDQRDAAAPLTPLVRERIRSGATAGRVLRILEDTARLGLGILSPMHDGWPDRLGGMHGAAPLLLWIRGNAAVLSTPSIAFAGTATLDDVQRRATIELATGLCSRGWTVVAGRGDGIDRLALRAADVMNQASVLVSPSGPDGQQTRSNDSVEVSELPPAGPATLESARRAKLITVALSGKVIVDDAASTSNLPILKAAKAMRRPLGLLSAATNLSTGSAPASGLWRGLPIVASALDVELLR